MTSGRFLVVEVLEALAFEPFGWVLGTACPTGNTARASRSPGSDFWHQHDFDPGEGGATEVLWVDYRNNRRQVHALEAHWLTQQAIVPLGGRAILHVVCTSRADDSRLPDLSRLRCFLVASGQGVCMRPGCWHASFVLHGQTTCLMLTRGSTTRELVTHLASGAPAVETSIVALASLGDAGEVWIQA